MTGSAKEHLGIRSALSVVLMLASHFVFIAAAAAGQQILTSSTSLRLPQPERRAMRARRLRRGTPSFG